MSVKYVVQRYERYRIYEPAEGGYYYEGRVPHDFPKLQIIYDTKYEAIDALRKLVKEHNESLSDIDDGRGDTHEGFLVIGISGTFAESINHKYIGEGFDFYVEPINLRGCNRKSYIPYS